MHWPGIDDALNGFKYTSVEVSISDGLIPHSDSNNIGPSGTITMGSVQGGLLCVESREGRTLPTCTATSLEPEIKGSNH
eukprot:8084215-Prorocentrum_lima.AAC.1